MKKTILAFSNIFVSQLGEFVKKQKENAESIGITKEEFRAISSQTFALLGRNHKEFTKRAGF